MRCGVWSEGCGVWGHRGVRCEGWAMRWAHVSVGL